MRLFDIKLSVILISLSILGVYGFPALTSDSNKLEHLEREPEDGMNSAEIMPGRYLTDQEMRNMVHLAQAEILPYYATKNPAKPQTDNEKHDRPKRSFIGLGRTPEERRRLRNERFHLRNERRRLRQEARRQFVQRQQELMRAFFGQPNQTIQRLNNNNAAYQQRVQNQAAQSVIRNPPQLILTVQTATASSSPAKLGTQSAVAVGTQAQQSTTPIESKPVFQQVALPDGLLA